MVPPLRLFNSFARSTLRRIVCAPDQYANRMASHGMARIGRSTVVLCNGVSPLARSHSLTLAGYTHALKPFFFCNCAEERGEGVQREIENEWAVAKGCAALPNHSAACDAIYFLLPVQNNGEDQSLSPKKNPPSTWIYYRGISITAFLVPCSFKPPLLFANSVMAPRPWMSLDRLDIKVAGQVVDYCCRQDHCCRYDCEDASSPLSWKAHSQLYTVLQLPSCACLVNSVSTTD